MNMPIYDRAPSTRISQQYQVQKEKKTLFQTPPRPIHASFLAHGKRTNVLCKPPLSHAYNANPDDDLIKGNPAPHLSFFSFFSIHNFVPHMFIPVLLLRHLSAFGKAEQHKPHTHTHTHIHPSMIQGLKVSIAPQILLLHNGRKSLVLIIPAMQVVKMDVDIVLPPRGDVWLTLNELLAIALYFYLILLVNKNNLLSLIFFGGSLAGFENCTWSIPPPAWIFFVFFCFLLSRWFSNEISHCNIVGPR